MEVQVIYREILIDLFKRKTPPRKTPPEPPPEGKGFWRRLFGR
jgi:hypothetical protein